MLLPPDCTTTTTIIVQYSVAEQPSDGQIQLAVLYWGNEWELWHMLHCCTKEMIFKCV